MDRCRVPLRVQQRLPSVASLDDVVAGLRRMPLPRPDWSSSSTSKMGLGAPECRRGHGPRRLDGCVHAWKVDLEGGPLAHLAVDPDAPAALLNDPEDGRQAEPRTLTLLLRREEGSKIRANVAFSIPVPVSVTRA